MPKDTYQWHVLLWVPNLIGYLRLLICILGVLCHYQSAHVWFLLLFLTNFALDGIDGYLARQLGQCSTFGAWFDVFVDLITRGFLWVIVNDVVGYCVICWEWLTFFAIHTIFGKGWKEPPMTPPLVATIMSNNFKTVHGFYIIGSLFLLPIWCYLMIHSPQLLPPGLSLQLQYLILVLLLIGRFLAAIAEGWYVSEFMKSLLVVSEEKAN